MPRPYFVEYGSYVDNHGGVLRPVASRPDFDLDLDAIEAAIGARTKAVLINSPHNPTGRVYPAESLAALGELLRPQVGGTGADHLPRVRRALPADRLRRGQGAAGHGRLREHHHRLELLQGAVAVGREDRLRGGQPGHPRDRRADGGADHGQPDPGLRQRAGSDAAGGRPAAGRVRGRRSLPAQPRRALRGADRGGLRGLQAGGRLLPVPAGADRGRRGLLPGDAAAPGAGGAGERLRPGPGTSAWPTAWRPRWSTGRCRPSARWGRSTSGRRPTEPPALAAAPCSSAVSMVTS